MAPAVAAQNDTIWLESKTYNVVGLNEKVSGHVAELARAIRNGIPAYPDSSREGFFDVELNSGWSYIHVRDDVRTVYLIAFSRN